MFPRESPPPRPQPPAEGVNVKPRTLGSTGYVVSELGFGGWGLGGSQWRGVDDGAARDALRAAVDRGITFFEIGRASCRERVEGAELARWGEVKGRVWGALHCELILTCER